MPYYRFNKGMNWNGHTIDVLIACTDQETDIVGLAPFYMGAAIVHLSYSPVAPIGDGHAGYYQHELSHLYCLQNCNSLSCIMYDNPNIIINDKWCDAHKVELINRKNYFTLHYLYLHQPNIGGKTQPCPGVYKYYHDLSPTTITIKAIPYNRYKFAFWLVNYNPYPPIDNPTIRQENPLSLTMDRTYDVHPMFAPSHGTGSGGGSA